MLKASYYPKMLSWSYPNNNSSIYQTSLF